jgi:S-DNA-T family DNA segregation ATPase FtsK/SpoIIIE
MAKAKSKPKTKTKKSEKHARYEALGVALFALGVLLLLALGWPRVMTGRNPMGPVGALLDSWFLAAFGGFGFLVSIPAFAWGLDSFAVIRRFNAARASAFAVVLLVFLPALAWLINSDSGGWLGTAVGPLLVDGFGTLGAVLIVAAVLLIATVLTLELSVARMIGRISGFVWAGLRRLVLFGWRSLRRIGSWLAAVVVAENGADVPEGATGSPEEPGLVDAADLSQTELPPLDLLTAPSTDGGGLGRSELKALGTILVEKLHTFRVEGKISGWTTGPVVTQFEVVPAAGVKVGQISALSDDLALALKAPSVRIVAPIPGKGAVGVEVPKWRFRIPNPKSSG